MEKVSCVSGYFDPIHVGHLEYFKSAKKIADKLIVIVNNDDQAVLKKGKPFMSADERIEIIKELKCVDYVVKSIDTDRTVRETIKILDPKPSYFCNGGDQNNNSIQGTRIKQRRPNQKKSKVQKELKNRQHILNGNAVDGLCIAAATVRLLFSPSR